MDVTGISNNTPPATGGTAANPSGMSSLKSEDFFRILTTELRNQDPFEPSKTSDMISQVSQIRDIELSGKMTNTLDSLASAQRTSGIGTWIGRYVGAKTAGADGTPQLVGGVVTGVRVGDDGTPVLELDTGQAVLSKDVVLVTTPENAQAAIASAQANAATNGAGAGSTQNNSNAQTSAGASAGATTKTQNAKPRNFLQKLGDLLAV